MASEEGKSAIEGTHDHRIHVLRRQSGVQQRAGYGFGNQGLGIQQVVLAKFGV
jgi:hypothetical protein